MTAFLDGFFSVFRSPFSVHGEILLMDWDEGGYVVQPAGEPVEPPSIRTSWKKVGDYLRNAMTEYEHHVQQ